jgi:hypothetical protein
MAQRQFDKLTEDQVFADWRRWIRRVYDESIGQAWRRKMFRLMRGIYEQNTNLRNTGSFFLTWAAYNYVAASAMALRRELDVQDGTENLFQMLCEIRARPTVLSRARFRSTWTGTSEYLTADRAFDRLRIIRHRDRPDFDHIDPDMIVDDLRRLRAQDAVLTHVQTTIAHRAPPRPDAPVPTFAEFHAALDAVGQVFERYYTILTHATLMSREPEEQFDIYEPFTFAWIADPGHFDRERS